MEQGQIKALLEEAAVATAVRRKGIFVELEKATALRSGLVKSNDLSEQRLGILSLAFYLYHETLKHRPALLPSLFPVFAMVCGDRKLNELLLTETVNWDLAEDYSRLSG